eukprot:scaffold628746_cov20-Prasinocladus_malaysianus.AAC.1
MAGILHSRPPGPELEYRKLLFVICPSSPAGSMHQHAPAADAGIVKYLIKRMILKNKEWKTA